jgi:hypothetical protein
VAFLIALSIREKVRQTLVREAEAKRAAMRDRVRKAGVGVITTVIAPGASWPCVDNTSSLNELMKLRNWAFHERAPALPRWSLFVETVSRNRSIMVEPGTRVKILLAQDDILKICLIDAKGDYLWAGVGYQAEASRGCWVSSDAVTH